MPDDDTVDEAERIGDETDEPTGSDASEDDAEAIPDDGMAPLITNTGGGEGIGDDADAASG